MSILRSLNTGAAGLRAHADAIDVVGDNIANVNTVGFKRSRAIFQDMLGRSIAGASAVPSAGGGSRVSKVQQMWSQGALMTTDSPTDLALSGDGFFIMKGTSNGAKGNFYSRAGQFTLNSDGFLTNPSGLVLQGYGVDSAGVVQTTLGDLLINPGTVAATPTTTVDLAANLDAAPGSTPLTWDPTNPGGTSNFSTQVTVYDSLGAAHGTTVYFVKGPAAVLPAPQIWDWHAMVDGAELVGGTAGLPTEIVGGRLEFDANGALDTEAGPLVPVAAHTFTAATGPIAITFNFGTSITTDGGTGLDGTTQFAAPSTTTGLSQDGFAAGSVAAISVAADGVVKGVFTNGQRRSLGQVAVADFGSVDGLARAGDGLWAETRESSQPLIGPPETGGRAAIVSGALEQSNVDLGQEFVSLIAFQRGFQANSKIITTADEMYQELVNLKR